MSASSLGICCYFPRRTLYPYSIIPLYFKCCIIGKVRAGECCDILLQWSISFIYISSSSILFVIFLCSAVIPLELVLGSNVSRETPDFPSFELSKCMWQVRSFGFT